MTYGLTTEGFNRKRLADILEELKASFRSTFGDDILVEGDSVCGQIIGIVAEREAEVWELAEAVYFSAFPDTATGVSLANAGMLTGHAPLKELHSTVTATVGAAGASPVTLPIGRRARVPSTLAEFETIEEVIIPAEGTVAVKMRAVNPGPVEAPSGTLTEIVTPVSGWDTITNAAGAIVGRSAETDEAFRLRRHQEMTIAKGGPIPAMEARIPELVDGVTYCAVTENRTSVEDDEGRPPHSVHVVVIGGDDQAVAEAIWKTKPGAADTHGEESATVIDSGGVEHTIRWDRATDVRIYLIVNATVDGTFPADGEDRIVALLSAYDTSLVNGDDVVNWRLGASLAGIPGITDLEILQGTEVDPDSTDNTPIAANERASISAADITVNTTP